MPPTQVEGDHKLHRRCRPVLGAQAFRLTDTGHALLSAFAAIVSARCDEAALVTTAPRGKQRSLRRSVHFCAQIEQTGAVSCAHATCCSARRWGRPYSFRERYEDADRRGCRCGPTPSTQFVARKLRGPSLFASTPDCVNAKVD